MSKNVSFCAFSRADAWLIFFLVVLAVAFLQPVHIWPFKTHLEDFSLGLAVVAVVGFMLLRQGRIYLNLFFYCWLLFGALLAISYFFVYLPVKSILLSYVGFWVVGLCLTQLGGRFSWFEHSGDLEVTLGRFLMLVSILSALGGLVKLYGLWGGISVYVPGGVGGRMDGLFDQSNNFAVICFMGVLSLVWLYSVGRLGFAFLLFWLSILCYCLVLTGTRVVYVAYLLFLVFCSCVAWYRRDFRFVFLFFLVGVFFIIFKPFVFILNDWFTLFVKANGFMPWEGVSFIGDRGMVDAPRMTEWGIAWHILCEHLPFGVGPGGYAVQSYRMHFSRGVLPVPGLWLHSHNSYLQLVVEFGWLGLLWLLAMAVFVVQALLMAFRQNSVLLAGVILTMLVYSFFEFPLWMMSFFVLTFFVVASGQKYKVVSGGRLIGGGAVLLSVGLLYFYWGMFLGLIRWHFNEIKPLPGGASSAFVDRMIKDPLLNPYALEFYYWYFDAREELLTDDLSELERLRGYRPYMFISSRYLITLAAVGRKSDALSVVRELLVLNGDSAEFVRGNIFSVRRQVPAWDIEYLLESLPHKK